MEELSIRTPDQRLRVFVSSTLAELAEERGAVHEAIERLQLTPVMFELGARPHPPRNLYRAYLEQSHIFVGIYWQRYGWVAPGETVSGLEDEYLLSDGMPRLLYVKAPAEEREPRLGQLLKRIQGDDTASYKSFGTPDERGAFDDVPRLGHGGLDDGQLRVRGAVVFGRDRCGACRLVTPNRAKRACSDTHSKRAACPTLCPR